MTNTADPRVDTQTARTVAVRQDETINAPALTAKLKHE